MSELENLTKTLIQVVGSLQQLISKRNTVQSTLEPEVPRLKKTPEMTYNQFIHKALASKKPVEAASKKSTFNLQEDLEILSQLSNYSSITVKCFEQIIKKKKLNRTVESLKTRYNDYLYKIGQEEMKKIVNWIEREGVQGFLNWDQQQLKIQLNDPNEKKEDKKRQRPSNIELEGKKQEKISKKSKNVPVNCKQLNQVLKLYSKMVNISIRQLSEYLDQLSGDLVALDTYIETKDNRMLWTSEEDQILRRGGFQVQILKRYRGQSVETRRKYLGL